MTEKTLSAQTIAGLSRKLDEFSEVLTADEHAVLLGLISTAGAAMKAGHADAESEGITSDRAVLVRPAAGTLPKLSGAISDTFRAVPGLGGFDPAGPVSDSIGVGVLCVSWSKDYKDMTPGGVVTKPSAAMRLPGMKTYR
ncbi:MAG: hypothetical protein ACT4PZ_16890 [Panacagrimonas sp.]